MSGESVGDVLPLPLVLDSASKLVVSCEASVGRAAETETEETAEVADATKDAVPEKLQVRMMALMSGTRSQCLGTGRGHEACGEDMP